MIKTLLASACVLACCMGNEYPAKAYGYECIHTKSSYASCMNAAQNRQIEMDNMQREIDQRLDRIESNQNWF